MIFETIIVSDLFWSSSNWYRVRLHPVALLRDVFERHGEGSRVFGDWRSVSYCIALPYLAESKKYCMHDGCIAGFFILFLSWGSYMHGRLHEKK